MHSVFDNFDLIIRTLVVIALLEIVASALWSHIYFTFGLPLYKRTLKLTNEKVRLPSAQELEDELPELAWRPPLLVRQIGEMKYAFREKLLFLGFSYTPVMHGVMHYDQDKKELIISGLANWYALFFSIFFVSLTVAFMSESKELMFLILPVGLLIIEGNGYLTQRRRFNQIVETIQGNLANN
jgi:hypothetical protein